MADPTIVLPPRLKSASSLGGTVAALVCITLFSNACAHGGEANLAALRPSYCAQVASWRDLSTFDPSRLDDQTERQLSALVVRLDADARRATALGSPEVAASLMTFVRGVTEYRDALANGDQVSGVIGGSHDVNEAIRWIPIDCPIPSS